MARTTAAAQLLAPGQGDSVPAPAKKFGPRPANKGETRPNPWEHRQAPPEPISVLGRNTPQARRPGFCRTDEQDELGGELEWRGWKEFPPPQELRAGGREG